MGRPNRRGSVELEVECIVNAAKVGDLSQRIDLEDKNDFFLRLSQGVASS